MTKLSDKIELLIAVEVATKGAYYQKNNWNTHTSFVDPPNDYVNLTFEVVAKSKVDGSIKKTERVRNTSECNDLEYSAKLATYYPTKITRYIPYTKAALEKLELIRGDLKLIANVLTALFAKKPENTTAALEKILR